MVTERAKVVIFTQYCSRSLRAKLDGVIQLLCSALGIQSSCKDDWVLIRAAWSSQNIPVILAEILCAGKECLVLSFWTSICISDGIMIKKKSFWPIAQNYFSMQIPKSQNFAYLSFHQGSKNWFWGHCQSNTGNKCSPAVCPDHVSVSYSIPDLLKGLCSLKKSLVWFIMTLAFNI